MPAVKRTEDFQNLITSLRSFGYAVMQAQKRIFCLAPGSDTIFILRKLQREGYWEMNLVDRFMWEKYGAMGYPIRPWITVPELLEFLYTFAAGEEAIKQGLIVRDTRGIFEKNNFEPSLERLQRKLKDMYMRHDMLFCDVPTPKHSPRHTKAVENLKKQIKDPDSEFNEKRKTDRPIVGINDGRAKHNRGPKVR